MATARLLSESPDRGSIRERPSTPAARAEACSRAETVQRVRRHFYGRGRQYCRFMRAKFPGYYSPTPDEFDVLWSDAFIAVDANILLDLFRYSPSTRDSMLDTLKLYRERLWLPHQAGLEFHRNRWTVVGEQESGFDKVRNALDAAEKQLTEAITGLHRGEASELETLARKVAKRFAKLRSAVDGHADAAIAPASVLDRVTELFEGRVGSPYEDEETAAIEEEGKTRYASRVPPGYLDIGKAEPGAEYGDLILWKQLIAHGATERKPLIFVTRDLKDDWWTKSAGKTRSPRPELVTEYLDATDSRMYLYPPHRFLAEAQRRAEQEVNKVAVEEVKRSSLSLAEMIAQIAPASSIPGPRISAAMQDQIARLAESQRFSSALISDMAALQLAEAGKHMTERYLHVPVSGVAAAVAELAAQGVDPSRHSQANSSAIASVMREMADRTGSSSARSTADGEPRTSAELRRALDSDTQDAGEDVG